MNNENQLNSQDNQSVSAPQPTNITPESVNTPIPTQSDTPSSSSETTPNPANKTKRKRILIVITAIIIISIIGAIITLFLTGIIGGRRVEVGEYTVVINDKKWDTSIGPNGVSLILTNKNSSSLSSISILPYSERITYEVVSQKNAMEDTFNVFGGVKNYKIESQSEKVINGDKCIVANAYYTNDFYIDKPTIKAFCENKDGIIFLIEVEGSDQTELDSNFNIGTKIINTARHK